MDRSLARGAWLGMALACICLAFGPGCSRVRAATGDRPVPVFLMAGQSNMDGRGVARELTGPLAAYAEPLPQVQVLYNNPDLPRRPGKGVSGWAPLQPGFSVPPAAYGGATFGPELGFGHAYVEARPDERLHLIKFSKGGTTLLGHWRPDEDDGLAAEMIRFTRKSLAELSASGTDYELVGLLWHQGESDLGAERKRPGAYKAAMLHFVERLRRELDAPDLRVILGEVYNQTGQREEIIRAFHDTAAADPRIVVVRSTGLSVSDGDNNMRGTHFDTASQIELGRRMAEAVLGAADAQATPESAQVSSP